MDNDARLLQACSTPPEPVSLVMPLAPHGSLHDFLHGTAVYQGGVLRRGLGSSGINGHGGVAGRNCHGGGGRGYARLSAGEKVAMAFDVARGMLHLHSHGFLHGSLKSKNVMVRWIHVLAPVFLELEGCVNELVAFPFEPRGSLFQGWRREC